MTGCGSLIPPKQSFLHSFIFESVLLCSPDWSATHDGAQEGFELVIFPP